MKASTYSADHTSDAAFTSTRFVPALLDWFGGVMARRRAAVSSRALRRQLAEMDEAMLRDIGIDEGEIWQIRQQRHVSTMGW